LKRGERREIRKAWLSVRVINVATNTFSVEKLEGGGVARSTGSVA
jgi:hypothetical protein